MSLYTDFDVHAMLDDIEKRRFITMGMAAWLLLVPLAATSTNWAIRKLGGKRWSRLHKLVYVAAICGVIHYWWQVKPGVLQLPLRLTIALAVLLLARPLPDVVTRRKAQAALQRQHIVQRPVLDPAAASAAPPGSSSCGAAGWGQVSRSASMCSREQ